MGVLFYIFHIYPKICTVQTHHSIVNLFPLNRNSLFFPGRGITSHSFASNTDLRAILLFISVPHPVLPTATSKLSNSGISPLPCSPSPHFFPLLPIFWTSWTYIFSLLLAYLLAFDLLSIKPSSNQLPVHSFSGSFAPNSSDRFPTHYTQDRIQLHKLH